MNSRERVRAALTRRIPDRPPKRTLGPKGLLLCPAYDIDFSPRENILAFADEVEALL